MRLLLIFIGLLVQTLGTAQSLTQSDIINSDKFQPDGQIKGIGLVEVNLDSGTMNRDFMVYDSKGEPKIKIRVQDKDVVTTIGTRTFNRNNRSSDFSPRQFGDNPDYFRLIFDCTKVNDQYYEVVINQKTNEKGFIKKSDNSFFFETATQYVTEWTTLGFDFDRNENPLRTEPSNNSTVIPNNSKYKIWRAEKIELKGDWIKVKTSDKEEGWVRWKQGDKIIIRLYFVC